MAGGNRRPAFLANLKGSVGQTSSSLGPSPRQDATSIPCGHSFTETMLSGALAFFRLICAQHPSHLLFSRSYALWANPDQTAFVPIHTPFVSWRAAGPHGQKSKKHDIIF